MIEYKQGDRVRIISLKALRTRMLGTLGAKWLPQNARPDRVFGMSTDAYEGGVRFRTVGSVQRDGPGGQQCCLLAGHLYTWPNICLWPAEGELAPYYPGASVIHKDTLTEASGPAVIAFPCTESPYGTIANPGYVVQDLRYQGSYGHGGAGLWYARTYRLAPVDEETTKEPAVDSHQAPPPFFSTSCRHLELRIVQHGEDRGFIRCLTPGCGCMFQFGEGRIPYSISSRRGAKLVRGPDSRGMVKEIQKGRGDRFEEALWAPFVAGSPDRFLATWALSPGRGLLRLHRIA